MKRILLVMVAALVSLSVPIKAFTQSSNASLSGTISDASGAVLPGAVITATNTSTNAVLSARSNSAGIYNFSSLQPGTYKVSAELAGFQTLTTITGITATCYRFRPAAAPQQSR